MVVNVIGGRYRMLERHAVGGMATLWRARDERTGELVALKRLHPFLVADPRARGRLVREAAALKAVDHPAITRPREVIDDPDDPALVMDFAEGRSLQDRLATDGPFDPDEAVAIVGMVADALAVAHEAGIVHRDIKPANILVEDSGAVHLVDFGIATLGADDATALTATGTMIGTVRYAAPERLAGGESTPQSDVWGLGAVLYELLSGRPAVTIDAPDASPGASRGVPADVDDLPASLGSIVRRSMAPDPADRYPDASAFRDALPLADVSVDPEAVTSVVPVPVAAPVPAAAAVPVAGAMVDRPPALQRRPFGVLSPVDRAAAVFFAAVGAVTLAALVALGLGGLGGATAPPPDPAAPAIEVAPSASPSPIDAVATPSPDDDEKGRGRGKGRGNDKDEGNGRGSGGGEDD